MLLTVFQGRRFRPERSETETKDGITVYRLFFRGLALRLRDRSSLSLRSARQYSAQGGGFLTYSSKNNCVFAMNWNQGSPMKE
jgi:hypothetical protein